jgi:flagellar FliJ protein
VTRPFQFRLERVRALREHAEEQAQEELANSLAIRLKGEAMLRAASESVDDARDARRRSSSADLSGADLIALQAYMERAQLQRESAALELDRREAEVDARRAALTQRSQERQVLEKLKERRAEDHRVESERRESVVLDEMALNMHRRTESAL